MTQSLQSRNIKYELSSGARHVVEVALQKAQASDVEQAPSSALLEALVQEIDPNWHAAIVLRSYGVDVDATAQLSNGDYRSVSDILFWARDEANRSFNRAHDEDITTEHLLLALIAHHDPTATLLCQHGMYVDKVRELLIKMSGPVTAVITIVS